MPKDFKLPDLGEGVHEGRIIRVLVKEGQSVREDQPLMEVETDKAAVEVPSPFSGVIEKVHIRDKQLVHVGDVMFTFGGAGKAETTPPSLEGGGKGVGGAPVAATPSTSSAHSTHPPTPSLKGRGDQARPSPQPSPSGRGGTITPASPAVRKRAREMGVEIETIAGSGPAGRVTMQDLESAPPLSPRERAGVRVSVAQPAFAPPRTAAAAPGPPRAREELTQARKTIALTMAQSWSTIPHVTDCEDADITDLERLRKGYAWPPPAPGEKIDSERKLSILPFVVRAVAMALRRHPVFNSSLDAQASEIIHHEGVHIAVGVHTERGLIAPVLRDADRLSVIQIAEALNELALKAREVKFTVADLRGATYTISNAGAMGGSRYSTPLITPPQVAVLALGRTRWEPRVVEGPTGGAAGPGGAIAPRYILPLSHSFDHRIIDGGQEIAFQQDVIGSLQNPARLMF